MGLDTLPPDTSVLGAVCGVWLLPGAKDPPHTGYKLARAEGLDHKVRHAKLQAPVAGLIMSVGGEDHNRNSTGLSIVPQVVQHAQSIHLG